MKKFYSFALAAIVALSASAFDFNKTNVELKSTKETTTLVKKSTFAEKSVAKSGVMKAQKASGATGSIEGTWTFTFLDEWFQTSNDEVFTVDFEASLEEYEGDILCWFDDVEATYGPYVAIYDETSGTLTFNMEVMEYIQSLDVFGVQVPVSVDPKDGKLKYGLAFDGKLNSSFTEIALPEDCALGWAAFDYADGYLTDIAGWFELNTLLNISKEGAGINGVEVEASNSPVVYYNLQGVRMENPTNGLFIRMQDGKATKVLIK